MRLLDTISGEFVYAASSSSAPPYVILSHVWAAEGEQSYQDIRAIQEITLTSSAKPLDSRSRGRRQSNVNLSVLDDPNLSMKVRNACAAARRYGYRYIWIDSCCIDKTSSAELSEAINSMYAWYHGAHVCFAYLADVHDDDSPTMQDSSFRHSRWFTRGWTLQELISPPIVIFMSTEWNMIGTKAMLAGIIAEITGIDERVLTGHRAPADFNVAQRMSWASTRVTTRVEDEAYALMGLFDVTMTTLYGEGRRAFIRLQEEILKQTPDQSLLAWGEPYLDDLPDPTTLSHPSTPSRDSPSSLSSPSSPRSPRRFFFGHSAYWETRRAGLQYDPRPFFADSPVKFASCGAIRAITHDNLVERLDQTFRAPEYNITAHGVRAQYPLLPVKDAFPMFIRSTVRRAGYFQWYLAILACEPEDRHGHLMAIICSLQSCRGQTEQAHTTLTGEVIHAESVYKDFRIVTLSPDHIAAFRRQIAIQTVYVLTHLQTNVLAHANHQRMSSTSARPLSRIVPAPWSLEMLRVQGFNFRSSGDPNQPDDCVLFRSDSVQEVNIHFQLTVSTDPREGGHIRPAIVISVSVSHGPTPPRSSPWNRTGDNDVDAAVTTVQEGQPAEAVIFADGDKGADPLLKLRFTFTYVSGQGWQLGIECLSHQLAS